MAVVLVFSLQGRGSKVVFLPGDDDADAGVVDEAGAKRKTVAELLALDPHDSNVLPPSYQLPICTTQVRLLKFGLPFHVGCSFHLQRNYKRDRRFQWLVV